MTDYNDEVRRAQTQREVLETLMREQPAELGKLLADEATESVEKQAFVFKLLDRGVDHSVPRVEFEVTLPTAQERALSNGYVDFAQTMYLEVMNRAFDHTDRAWARAVAGMPASQVEGKIHLPSLLDWLERDDPFALAKPKALAVPAHFWNWIIGSQGWMNELVDPVQRHELILSGELSRVLTEKVRSTMETVTDAFRHESHWVLGTEGYLVNEGHGLIHLTEGPLVQFEYLKPNGVFVFSIGARVIVHPNTFYRVLYRGDEHLAQQIEQLEQPTSQITVADARTIARLFNEAADGGPGSTIDSVVGRLVIVEDR